MNAADYSQQLSRILTDLEEGNIYADTAKTQIDSLNAEFGRPACVFSQDELNTVEEYADEQNSSYDSSY